MSYARPKVEIAERRSMSLARKLRIHKSRDGKCWMCGKIVPPSGPDVRYDHRKPLELGGSDDDANLYPLHTDPCDKLKTKADRQRIDKAKRLAGETCTAPPARPLQGRPFDQTRRRKMDGTVVLRRPRQERAS